MGTNLYTALNQDLRMLAREHNPARPGVISAWAPFMYYCIQGLTKCPTVPPGTVTWWARPEPVEVLQNIYHLGDDIFVCTFTHSTLDFNLACSRTNYMGTLLELTLLEGFRVGNVTGNHRDVILPPNARFAVTSAPVRRLTGFAEKDGPPKTKMRRSLVVVATKRNWWTSSSCSSSLTRWPSRRPGLGSQRRACAALAPCLRGSCACAVDLGRAAHRPRRTRMR